MVEIFAARNVTSPFLKRSDRPAGIKSKDCKGASRVGCIHLLAIEFPCGCWNFQGSRHFEVTYHPQRSKNLFFLFFWQKFSQPFYLLFTKEKATKLFRKKVFSNKVNKLGRCDNLQTLVARNSFHLHVFIYITLGCTAKSSFVSKSHSAESQHNLFRTMRPDGAKGIFGDRLRFGNHLRACKDLLS